MYLNTNWWLSNKYWLDHFVSKAKSKQDSKSLTIPYSARLIDILLCKNHHWIGLPDGQPHMPDGRTRPRRREQGLRTFWADSIPGKRSESILLKFGDGQFLRVGLLGVGRPNEDQSNARGEILGIHFYRFQFKCLSLSLFLFCLGKMEMTTVANIINTLRS